MARAFSVLLLLMLPVVALGQAINTSGSLGVDPLSVQISPRYPRAGESVRVTPSSTIINLSGSTVVVTADGKEVGRGSGNQSYAVPVGGLGSRTNVRISVSGPDGNYVKDIAIRPTDVALVLDSLSTSHPFYEGGNLVAPQGRVRIVAIADLRTDAATKIPSSNLIYTWKSGGRILQADSGLGKSILTATAPVLFRDTTVTVTVSTQDGAIAGEASVLVSPQEPLLLLYRNNALMGPEFFRTVSGTYVLGDTEEAFRAVPYFFPETPSLVWRLEDTFAGDASTVTVRTTGDQSGSASLEAEAALSGSYYRATDSLLIRYGTTNGGGFFGL